MHLYVGNLAPTVTEGDLRVIFEGAGEVVFAQLNHTGVNDAARGYAYVALSDSAQAQIAVEALNGRYLKGTAMVVEAVAERARVGARPQEAARRLPSATAPGRRTRAAELGLSLVKGARC